MLGTLLALKWEPFQTNGMVAVSTAPLPMNQTTKVSLVTQSLCKRSITAKEQLEALCQAYVTSGSLGQKLLGFQTNHHGSGISEFFRHEIRPLLGSAEEY